MFLWYQVELLAHMTIKNTGKKKRFDPVNSLILKIKKEVIQPQVPLRLPCDDLAHLTELRFNATKKAAFYLNPARLA